MGQTVRLGKRNTLCCKSRMEMYFYLVGFMICYFLFCFVNFLFFIFAFILFVMSSESPSDGDLVTVVGLVGDPSEP